MRTTLTLDDDIFDAARAIAEARGVSIGAVVSQMARVALAAPTGSGGTRNGIQLFPVTAGSQ